MSAQLNVSSAPSEGEDGDVVLGPVARHPGQHLGEPLLDGAIR